MKKIILLCAFFLAVVPSVAQEKSDKPWQTEHKGIDVKVRGGYASGLGDAKGADIMTFELSIGKRFDNMYFGLSSGAWTGTASGSDAVIPITLDWETFWTKGRIVPTTLLRTGFGINTASDIPITKNETIKVPNFLIVQLMPGVRLGITRRMDLDLAVGLTSLTSVGGSEGTSGTNAYLTFSGSLNFHKSTNPKPKKPKKPTRERGIQLALEGGKVNFGADEEDYRGGNLAFSATYKFNHHLSAGFGFGGDVLGSTNIRGEYLKANANGKDTRTQGVDYSLESVPKVFVRGQYNLTKKRFSPFVACDAGVRFYQYDTDDYGISSVAKDYEEAENLIGTPSSVGVYVEPAIGLSIRTTNNSYFDLKVGYSLSPTISGEKKTQTNSEIYSAAYRSSLKTSVPFVSLGFRHTFGWGSKWGK